MAQKLKVCSICKKNKNIKEFRSHKLKKDGLYTICRFCEKIKDKNRAHHFNRRFTQYKSSAKSRKINFSINKKYFKEITNRPCIYCGKYSYNKNEFCGVDRLNSNKGYTKKYYTI